MPKSTTSTSKVTKLKQGKLDFSAKRATTGAKVKGSTIKSAASSAKGSKSSTPIDVDSSDDTEDHDTTPKARKIKSAARPAAKRRKIDSNAALSGETDEGILKLRDGVKNSGGGRPVQEEKMPPLHPNDKKWAKLYREASAKMGHIEPGGYPLGTMTRLSLT